MINRWLVLLTLFASLIITNSVFAHGDEGHNEKPGPHGGQLVLVGDMQLELTVDGQTIQLYVTDRKGKPIDVNGAKGNLLVLSNKRKSKLPLSAIKNNLLSATGVFTANEKMKIIVTLEIPGKPSLKARFTPITN